MPDPEPTPARPPSAARAFWVVTAVAIVALLGLCVALVVIAASRA
jgi:hypothetical protein